MDEPKKFIEGFYYLGATEECDTLVIKAVKRYDDTKVLEVEVLEPNMETAFECGCIYVDYDMNEFTIIHSIMFSAKETTKAPKKPDMVDVVRCDQCFHAQHDQGPGWCTCNIHDLGIISTSWFCADGEVEV